MLERAWIDAINRHDTAVVDRILADDFEGIDQAGNAFDKAAALREPLLGAFLTDSYAELDQVKTRVFGDTAVATSRFKVRDSAARGVMTHVYVQRRGRWQCVASHASWASGAVCPAIGPSAERIPNSIREPRGLSAPIRRHGRELHRPATRGTSGAARPIRVGSSAGRREGYPRAGTSTCSASIPGATSTVEGRPVPRR